MAVIVVDVMSITVAANIIAEIRAIMVVVFVNDEANAVTVTGAV